MILSDDSPLGRRNEIKYVFHLSCQGQCLLHFLYALCDESFGVDDTISIMDEVNLIFIKTSAAQTDDVDTCIADGLFAGNDIGWDVLTGTAASLYHDIASNVAKLMDEHRRTDDGIVVDNDFASKFGRVTDDEVVAEETVMSDMHIFHEQTVVADLSGAF